MATHRIQRGEVELACHTFGTGPPVLLLHGFPFDHTMWQTQIEAMQGACQVIAPDLRGFGQSTSAPQDAEVGVAMQTYAEDLIDVLDQLEVTEPLVVGGFSMGGYILWQLLQQMPDRLRGMVLCDTRAMADTPAAAQGRQQMADRVLREGVDPLVESMLPKLLAADTYAARPALVKQVEGMIRQAPADAVAAALRGMARRPDLQPMLSQFSWPALVVVGAEDAISAPAEMRELAHRLPQAELVEITAAGHMSPLENPESVNEALLGFVQALSSD